MERRCPHSVVRSVINGLCTFVRKDWSGGLSVNAVLGHYPDYVDAADLLGAARFDVPGPVWAAWGAAGSRWSRNQAFLDESINRGRFLTTTPPALARPGSVFLREVRYLRGQGFTLVPTQNMDLY